MRYKHFFFAGLLLLTLYINTQVTEAATTWTSSVNDSFTRATSSSVGNGWIDPNGLGSISNNKLRITLPAATYTHTEGARILRPVSEADVNQRMSVTWTATDASSDLSHGVLLRAKPVMFGGVDIQPAFAVMYQHNGQINVQQAFNGTSDFVPLSGGTQTFTPVIGNTYTLDAQIVNNYPAVITATIVNNTASTTVASITYSYFGKYVNNSSGNASLITEQSSYFNTAGVLGLVFTNSNGVTPASFDLTNVTTYSYSDPGAFSAPAAISIRHSTSTRLASPLPVGGTPPYTIRWYRGAGAFTPPTNINGTGGSGSFVFLGTGQEIIDTSAPVGVSNFSNRYSAVYFDSGTASTTGVAGTQQNLNSNEANYTKRPLYPLWIGDSITFGFLTSSNSPSTSPGLYAASYYAADASSSPYIVLNSNKNVIGPGTAPGKTSSDFAGTLRKAAMSWAAHSGANVASIMLGTNDAKDSVQTSPATYKANMQSLIDGLRTVNPNIKIVLNKPIWLVASTTDFSGALPRIANYSAKLDELADGSIVVGGQTAYAEFQRAGFVGTPGVANVPNAATSYPPAIPATSTRSYLVDGLHPYDGGAQMMARLEWYPNLKNAMAGVNTPPADSSAPTVSITSPADGLRLKDNSLTINATSTDNISVSGVTFYRGTTTIGVEDTSSPYSVSWDTTSVADGIYSLTAVARDAAGNRATSSAVSVTLDKSAPVISGVATSTLHNQATITFITNEVATSSIDYGTTLSYGSTVSTSTASTSQTFTITGLSPLTTYNFRITVTDDLGNNATSTNYTIVTTAIPDSTAPSVSLSVPADGQQFAENFVTVSATASDNISVSGVTFYRGTTTIGVEDTSSPYSVSWDTTSVADGTYSLTAVARDAAGNRATSSAVSVTLDKTAPVISGVATSTMKNSAGVEFLTNEASTSTLEYGPSPSFGSSVVSNSLSTNHSYTVSNLDDGTAYYFKITVSDALGNSTSTSQDIIATTTAQSRSSGGGGGGSSSRVQTTQSTSQTPAVPSSSVATNTVPPRPSIGQTGQAVVQLQQMLVEKGFLVIPPGVAPGYFGPLTNAAYNAFIASNQSSAPTAPTSPVPSTTFSRTLSTGSSGADVKELQKFLNAKGFTVSSSGVGSPGNETTYFGLNTRNALIRYQQSRGIVPASGLFGPITRAAVISGR